MAETPDYGLIDRAGGGSGIFYPRPDGSAPPRGAEDLAIDVGAGVTLGGRLYAFDPTFATILYFHGNGEVVGDHDEVAPMYGQVGANLLVVDFRGYGQSGDDPRSPRLSRTVPGSAAVPRVARPAAPSRTRLVMGRSLGAHPALEIAANASDGFAGLIIESGAGTCGGWEDAWARSTV
jgi:alpha-beta hydrolase superfamily lysophospholipase